MIVAPCGTDIVRIMPAAIARSEKTEGAGRLLEWSPANTRRKRAWLRLAAGAIVLFLAVGVRYDVASNPPVYAERASVVFSLPKSQTAPSAYLIFAPSLIATSEAMVEVLLGPQGRQQIRAAGGTAGVSIALVNLYDQEYPNYGVPLANLTISSPRAANVHPTFVIATRLLRQLLTARQASLNVRPHNRISAHVIGDSGLTSQDGSPKRVLAGLAVLALIAYSALCGFLGRRGAAKRLSRHGQQLSWPGRSELGSRAPRLNPVAATRRSSGT
jgi:hypothetical protein